MTVPSFWSPLAGRELDMTPLAHRGVPQRVVACLNVWNDLGALQASVPTWKMYVDHVIVVDGSYDTVGCELSTDGTREYLRAQFDSIEILDAAGMSQCEKRTRYLERGKPGDYLFVIDADEHVLNPSALAALPSCDIGWARIRSPLYTREYGQPRIFRWRPGLTYAGRHHWMYEGTRLFCTHQYGGPGYAHRPVALVLSNNRNLGRDAQRGRIKASHLTQQMAVEAPLSAAQRTVMSDASLGARECLWILNYAYRDDGIAPSRFHTAINRTTPHASTFFKSRPGPFGVPTQYDMKQQGGLLVRAVTQCDVLHIHTVVTLAHRVTRNVPHVFHHHGSLLRANRDKYLAEAKKKRALVIVSNLELLSHTGDYPAFFLPNTMPVARYRALASASHAFPYKGNGPFRVAHSPTRAERKGTKQFLAVCARLAQQGVPIEPVLISDTSHAETLRVKSTCHAAFDSFWLGIQCSGLEAGAMGMPVVAGDPIVAARYREQFGEVPYTYANSEEELEAVLRQLVEDESFRMGEAERVEEYVNANHDESAVALTYLDYLDLAFNWRASKKRNGTLPAQSRLTWNR